jgi:hypothetical protein
LPSQLTWGSLGPLANNRRRRAGSMDLSQSALRARIRELIASGALPGEPPSIERPVDRLLSNRRARTLIGDRLRELCTICDDEGSQVAYFGRVVRVRAACDALWKLECMLG